MEQPEAGIVRSESYSDVARIRKQHRVLVWRPMMILKRHAAVPDFLVCYVLTQQALTHNMELVAMEMHRMPEFVVYIHNNQLRNRSELELYSMNASTNLLGSKHRALAFLQVVTIAEHFFFDVIGLQEQGERRVKERNVVCSSQETFTVS